MKIGAVIRKDTLGRSSQPSGWMWLEVIGSVMHTKYMHEQIGRMNGVRLSDVLPLLKVKHSCVRGCWFAVCVSFDNQQKEGMSSP